MFQTRMDKIFKNLSQFCFINLALPLPDYDSGITKNDGDEATKRAAAVGGRCATISALQILEHFNINVSDEKIKLGLNDCHKEGYGSNQVDMALFMSQYLDVTFCVKFDFLKELDKIPNSKWLKEKDAAAWRKLADGSIKFSITPSLREIVKSLKRDQALAQFNIIEPNDSENHFGLLAKVEDQKLLFTQRVGGASYPDVPVFEFKRWWDLYGRDIKDPERLVIIYRKKRER